MDRYLGGYSFIEGGGVIGIKVFAPRKLRIERGANLVSTKVGPLGTTRVRQSFQPTEDDPKPPLFPRKKGIPIVGCHPPPKTVGMSFQPSLIRSASAGKSMAPTPPFRSNVLHFIQFRSHFSPSAAYQFPNPSSHKALL